MEARICLPVRSRRMDDFSYLKLLLENTGLTYWENEREGEGCMTWRKGGHSLNVCVCDRLISTCKRRSEHQALLAARNPVQMCNDSLSRCSIEVHAIYTFDGILWDILQPFPATAWGNNAIIVNLSCFMLRDASCKNSFYVTQSTWLLLVSTHQHRPASLSRRLLAWIFRKKRVFEGISWSFFF